MSRKYAPTFATLVSVQNAGEAYAMISLMITPSLLVAVKHDLIVGGGWGPSTRRRDAPDANELQR